LFTHGEGKDQNVVTRYRASSSNKTHFDLWYYFC